MIKGLVIVVLLCGFLAAQDTAPIRSADVKQRKEVFRNERIAAFLLEIAAGDATPMHHHDKDILTTFLGKARLRHTISGRRPVIDGVSPGEVRFRRGGLTHATENAGKSPLRATIVEFAEPQGKPAAAKTSSSRYCNSGSKKACVEEKYLFCTNKVCVEDVTIAPGAVTIRHSHPTDHMLIAVSDYELTDEAEGQSTTVRARKCGEVEYIRAGITHQLTNTATKPARFIVVVFR